ncbi:hypothetical protein AB6A40_001344 [Gnathostoma spinigerum]|uniref:PITH domain-containing protein n=1 Tax=Gnathostoma spinigerum TaxID=75299 RepID=A0ABD6E4Y8_9BILA
MCSHGHNGGCGDEVANVVGAFEGSVYAMNAFIDTSRVTVLNETIDGSGVKVFKSWDRKCSREEFVESDVDEELLFNIPFTAHVKLTGILFVGDMDGTHPSRLKIFKDRPSMSFADAETAIPDQEMAIKQDSVGEIDYPLKVSKFSNVSCISLYFPSNFGADQTRLYYIGLRGEYQCDFRQAVTIANYEARPMADDHKAEHREQVFKDVC